MKKMIIGAVAGVMALSAAGAAFAQAKLTIDSPIESIAANPAGKAVLDKDLPGLTSHEAFDSFKAMSLKDVAPMSNGVISDEALAKVAADLAAIK
jgi:hypothetical protein